MTSEQYILIGTILSVLLGGGLWGAIATGRQTKSLIEKTNAEAGLTYQKMAALAAESELSARERERSNQDKSEAIIDRLEAEARARNIENAQLKHVISTWSEGIKILHVQLGEKEMVPRWKPNVEDLAFLSK